jgi:Raf kinase inhibitor-like YbhB/YbcL family protein
LAPFATRRVWGALCLLLAFGCGDSGTKSGVIDAGGHGQPGDGDKAGDGDGDTTAQPDGGTQQPGDMDAGSEQDAGSTVDASADDAGSDAHVTKPFELTSSALTNEQPMDDKYTCAGGDHQPGNDLSPPFAWGPGELAAKSYALVFADMYNDKTKLHWVLWDIPAQVVELSEGLGEGFELDEPKGAKQAALEGKLQFFGPCPGGSEHPYQFTLYALDVATLPDVDDGSSMAEVVDALDAHSLGTSTLKVSSDAAHD